MTRIGGAVAALVCLVAAAGTAESALRYDPRLRFRTIATARFDIHYHQGEEALAQRLARIAEDVATTLSGTLGRANGRVQVILVDQNDLPNGWATPVPYNTIEITAASPAADSIIGNTDDWLRLVFTHEYVHIVHLSRAGGWVGGLQKVFGRLPILYPNLFQPIWQIEGIATWQESAQTGAGRVHAGDFRLILERASADRRLEPLDRASSITVGWPSGTTPYAYGAYFHQYLADRYGADSLRRLTDETAKRLPYFGSRAFDKVFGRSLGRLWSDFEASVPPRDEPAAAERLTRHGYYVTGPRFRDDGRLLYSLADAHGFPSLMELDLTSKRPRAIADRYLGDHVGLAGDEVVFDQIEVVRDVGRQSDLYSVSLRDGRVRRLSRGARAADPDVSPDGSKVVFTTQRADRRELAIAPLAPSFAFAPTTIVSTPDVDFASPRWSPDGRRIAAERRARGGASDIVVIDAGTGAAQALVASGRNANPVWSPDGGTIYFAGATDALPFQIFSVPAGGGPARRLEGTGAYAQFPAIAPDGRTIAFVGYTADGYDLFSLPLANARWTPAAASAAPPEAVATTAPAPDPLPSRPYSPAGTILPRFWTPTFESDEGELVVGAAAGSFDALARHGYAVEAGWTSARARPDWQAAYAYDRWRPTLFAVFSDDTDPWRGGERRTVEANAGMVVTSRRIRWSRTILAELHTSTETFDCETGDPACAPAAGLEVRRTSPRGGVSFDTARTFGYSISPEEGGRLAGTVESAHAGSAGSSLSATVDARRYVRAWPRHAAIAVRGAAAASWGDATARRVFSASGNEPQTGGFRFGSDAIGLMRGLADDRLFGYRAAVVNADYRFPIAHVERGVGTLPVLLKSAHGAVFVDAGHAWSARFRSSDVRYSVGAELSVDTVLGYFAPVTFTAGGAWRDGPDPDDRGFAAFARIGRAF